MTIAKLSKKEINEAIEVRRTLVDEIEENIFEIPDFFYSLQESGLQPEDDDKLSEDFYYITRRYVLLMRSVFQIKHFLNLIDDTAKAHELALDYKDYGVSAKDEVKIASKEKLLDLIDDGFRDIAEALQDIITNFDSSEILKDIVAGEKHITLSFWLSGYFYNVMQAVYNIQHEWNYDEEIFDISDDIEALYQNIEKQRKENKFVKRNVSLYD